MSVERLEYLPVALIWFHQTVGVKLVDSGILNLLVLGTPISKHVNASATRYRVLIYLVFLMRADSALFASAELGLRLNVVVMLLRVIPRAMRLI